MNNQHSVMSKSEHISFFDSGVLSGPPHSVVVDSSGLPVKFVIELDAKKLRFPTETTPTLDAAEGSAIEQCVFED